MPPRQPPDTAARFLPDPADRDPARLRQAAAGCTACPLHETGTRTVFGEGPERAPLMLVGEQPGDQEDQAGRPFIGPAGQLLDRALHDAGIDRSKTYVTNTVKHFKWVRKGRRRLHEKPGRMEIIACLPWLEAEIAAIAPTGIVCLGATAAQALIGRGFKVTQDRGRFLATPLAGWITGTIHPSALLRMENGRMRAAAQARFVADLAAAAERLAAGGPVEQAVPTATAGRA